MDFAAKQVIGVMLKSWRADVSRSPIVFQPRKRRNRIERCLCHQRSQSGNGTGQITTASSRNGQALLTNPTGSLATGKKYVNFLEEGFEEVVWRLC